MANKNLSLAFNLAAVVLGMLMLAFASVPLYRVFCSVTGYGGTTQEAKHAPGKILDRVIEVRFNADMNPGMPWQFHPGEASVKVKVGQQAMTHYVARNLSDKPVTGRAVYNVLPFEAGAYFNKIECFCFTEQTLAAKQEVSMPVLFFIDPSIANDPQMKDVQTITLSYTFFPVKK